MQTDADETLTCGCVRHGMLWTQCPTHQTAIFTTRQYGAVEFDRAYTPLASIQRCGCWIVNLARVKAVLLCEKHEPEIIKMISPNE